MCQVTRELATYYAARAAEYERIYDKPERQPDLARLRQFVRDFFRARRVLEAACGTGYWTTAIASAATSITATDVSAEVLQIARAKPWPDIASVTFSVVNAFDLAAMPRSFDAGFAGFWWSHVAREQIGDFLEAFHHPLEPGSRVMLLDNRYVDGSSTPISRMDAGGNTFQERNLSNGSTYEVLKNFPQEAELRGHLLGHGASDVTIVQLRYYWYATYLLAAA